MVNKSKLLNLLFLSSLFFIFDAPDLLCVSKGYGDSPFAPMFQTDSPELTALKANLKLQENLSNQLEQSLLKLSKYKEYLSKDLELREKFSEDQEKVNTDGQHPIALKGLSDDYLLHQIESWEGADVTIAKYEKFLANPESIDEKECQMLENLTKTVDLKSRIDALKKGTIKLTKEGKIFSIQAQIDLLSETSKSPWGENIARALSGDRGWHGKVDSIPAGFMQGLAYSILSKFSKSLSEQVSDALDKVFGQAFSFAVDSGLVAWGRLRDDIFYDGYEGFSDKSLAVWQDLIGATFKDIRVIIKEGLKDSLRGRDLASRPLFDVVSDSKKDEGSKDSDSDDDSDTSGSAGAAAGATPGLSPEEAAQLAKLLDPWLMLVTFYSNIFQRLIGEFNERVKHYDPKSIEVFYAQQIIFLLGNFDAILETTKSINDLDAAFKSNKALIEAIQKGLDNVFKYLILKVTPHKYSLDSSGSGLRRKKNSSIFDKDDDDDDGPYHSLD